MDAEKDWVGRLVTRFPDENIGFILERKTPRGRGFGTLESKLATCRKMEIKRGKSGKSFDAFIGTNCTLADCIEDKDNKGKLDCVSKRGNDIAFKNIEIRHTPIKADDLSEYARRFFKNNL